eukprot:SAG31_NODE_4149_length_3529_cov_1.923032_1_plen_102_part_10
MNVQDDDGRSPLSNALSVPHWRQACEICNMLLVAGADPNMPHIHPISEQIVTPIDFAIEYGCSQLVHLLLTAGSLPRGSVKGCPPLLDLADEGGFRSEVSAC